MCLDVAVWRTAHKVRGKWSFKKNVLRRIELWQDGGCAKPNK